MSINRVILLGNVGKDPEIRATQNGDEVATFSLATSESWTDKATGEKKEQTQWHTVVVFNQHIIKVVKDHVKKGSKVAVEAAAKYRKWTDKEGRDRWSTEMVLDRFDGKLHLVERPRTVDRSHDSYGTTRAREDTPTPEAAPSSARDLDDEVPF